MAGKDKYGYKHEDGHYSKMTGKGSSSSYSIYDRNPSEKHHSGTHVNINLSKGKNGSMVEHGPDGKTSKTDISCYLTTACMQFHQDNFNDNCYELKVLRWFRDNFVTEEDISHYYEVAPIIVKAINSEEKSELIYDYIYDNIIDFCISQIENGNYDVAYSRYKNSILCFEEIFAKPLLEQKLIRVLKKADSTNITK